MGELSLYALFGLCIGFMWGIGCSLAILYSIYLGGYRKAVEDSIAPQKSERFKTALRRIELRRAKRAAATAEVPSRPS